MNYRHVVRGGSALAGSAGSAIALALAFQLLSAVAVYPQTLVVDEEAAVALATARDATAAAARLDATVAERRAAIADNFLLPSLIASVEATERLSSAADATTAGVAKLSSGLDLSAADFKARETTERKASELRVQTAVAEERIGRVTRKAFYRLILLSEQVALAEGAVAVAKVGVERTEEEYRNGLSSQLVKRQAEVSLEIERLALDRKRTERAIATAEFKSLLGVTDETELTLSGSLEAPSLAIDSSILGDLSARTDVALIAARQAIQESLIAEDRLARTVPKLSIDATVFSSVDDFFPGSSSPSLADKAVSGTSITLTLSSPNLSAFLPFSKELETTATLRGEARKLQVEREEIVRAARVEAETLLAELDVSRSAIGSLTASLSLAEEVLALSREAYAVGAASYQDLRTAEKDVDKARVDSLVERYAYLATVIDLEYAVGRRLRAAKE